MNAAPTTPKEPAMHQPALFDVTDAGLPVRPLFTFAVTVADPEPELDSVYVPDANQPTLPGLEEL